LVTEIGGFSFEVSERTFLIVLFIVVFTEVVILGVVFDHGVEDTGKFVSGCFDSDLRSMFGENSSIVGSECALAVVEASCGQTESEGSAAGGFARLRVEDFPAGNFVVGCQGEPGCIVFEGWPLGHIDAGFAEHHLHGNGIETVDLCEIDAGESVETGTKIIGWIVAGSFLGFGTRRQRSSAMG